MSADVLGEAKDSFNTVLTVLEGLWNTFKLAEEAKNFLNNSFKCKFMSCRRLRLSKKHQLKRKAKHHKH